MLAPGQYVDLELLQVFDVLSVGEQTVRVKGLLEPEERVVNRTLFERDMVRSGA